MDSDAVSTPVTPTTSSTMVSVNRNTAGFLLRLKKSNYISWSQSFQVFLRSQRKSDHLFPPSEAITADPARKADWEADDGLVMTWMFASMEENIASTVMSLPSATAVWAHLRHHYSKGSQVSTVYDIFTRLFSLEQSQFSSLDDYYAAIKRIRDEAHEFCPPTADLTQQILQMDMVFLAKYLGGLEVTRSGARDSILSSEKLPSLADAHTRVSRLDLPAAPVAPSAAPQDTAAHYSGGYRGRGRGRGRDFGRDSGRSSGRGRGRDTGRGGPRPPCTHCGGQNHKSDFCWVKFGRPAWASEATLASSGDTSTPVTTATPSSASSYDTEYEDFLRFREFTARRSSGATATSATTSTSTPAGSALNISHPTGWLVDSGASVHVTGDKSTLSSLTLSPNLPPIRVADGDFSPVTGMGKARPSPLIPLDRVHFAPRFPVSLLSVSKISNSLNCVVSFYPSFVVFQDLRTRKKIGGGPNIDDVYYLDSECPPPNSALATSSTSSSQTLLWHWRLGHPSCQKLQTIFPSRSVLPSISCEACQLGKHHRVPFRPRHELPSASPFDLVHSDIWGPSRIVSGLGFRYFLTFIDDHSRCTWVYLLKSRSEAGAVFQKFFHEIKTQFGCVIKTLRTDNALEFVSLEFESFCSQQGILHQRTCPYTSQQNGIAERKNRHLLDIARTIMFHMSVPAYLWHDAILTAAYLINRVPSSVLAERIPYSVLYPSRPLFGLKPRVFGCVAFVHDHSPNLDKLAPRSVRCVFVGYSRLQKGYRCFHPSSRRYYVSADVTFFEEESFFSSKPSSSVSPSESPTQLSLSPLFPMSPVPAPSPAPIPPIPPRPPILQVYRRRPAPSTSPSETVQDPSSTPPPLSPPHPISPPPPPPPFDDLHLPIALRKAKRTPSSGPYPMDQYTTFARLGPTFRALSLSISTTSIPQSHHEALTIPVWQQAMRDEMDALLSRGTWDLVTPPTGHDIVACRWVFTIKYLPDGTIDRYKARLVAKGFTQTYGVDYFETFSPVARLNSIRVLFSLAVNSDWPMYQLDVKNAFLYGDLAEEVYMEQPPGYVAQGENVVCKLKKAIYGLKQSPRAWFEKFSQVVGQIGFKRSHADHSVFIKTGSSGLVILMVYVDDILLSGSDTAGIAEAKTHLHSHFVTKDLGQPSYFLGIEIARSSRGIVLSQRKYAMDLLAETGLSGAKPADTPMDPNSSLHREDDSELEDKSQYRRLVGKLIYLTVTRPDIAFAVGVISQFMENPKRGHLDAALRILRYVKRSPGKGLFYQRHGHLRVESYSDADYAGSKLDRRSTSGYCTYVGGNLVTWKSKKQTVVARSSAESEYRAMAHTVCEMMWLRTLLTDLGVQPSIPMPMFCDNQAAIFIASNPVFHERTKHIEVDCHFVRDAVMSGQVSTPFTRSEDQTADLFTKPLAGSRFSILCTKLGMLDIYAPA